MGEKLKIYELLINEDEYSLVSAISIVGEPAIEENFLAFNKDNKQRFEFNDEKFELLGPALIPNELIYRKDYEGNEFKVFFSESTIRLIAQTFFKYNFQHNMNENHSSTSSESYVFQSFIVDSKRGINYKKFADGTWIVGAKINSISTWEKIKNGELNGFSIEGVFSLIEQKLSKDNTNDEAEILLLLAEIKEKLKTKK